MSISENPQKHFWVFLITLDSKDVFISQGSLGDWKAPSLYCP